MNTTLEPIDDFDYVTPEDAELRLLSEADALKLSSQNQAAIDFLHAHYDSLCDRYEYYEELGDNYLALRSYDASQKALLYALSMRPGAANALYLLGFLHSSTGLFETSAQLLELALTQHADHPEILRCLGWSTFHAGDQQGGLVYLAQAHELWPNDPHILLDSAVAHASVGHLSTALKFAEQAVELEPSEKAVRVLTVIKEKLK